MIKSMRLHRKKLLTFMTCLRYIELGSSQRCLWFGRHCSVALCR